MSNNYEAQIIYGWYLFKEDITSNNTSEYIYPINALNDNTDFIFGLIISSTKTAAPLEADMITSEAWEDWSEWIECEKAFKRTFRDLAYKRPGFFIVLRAV